MDLLLFILAVMITFYAPPVGFWYASLILIGAFTTLSTVCNLITTLNEVSNFFRSAK